MNQSDLIEALENLLGKEVIYIEYPGAIPFKGVLQKQEEKALDYVISDGEKEIEFHYMESDVTPPNIVWGHVMEGFN